MEDETKARPPSRDGGIASTKRFVIILEADAAAPRADTAGILEALALRGSGREDRRIAPLLHRWAPGDTPAEVVAGLRRGPLGVRHAEAPPQWCVLVRVNPASPATTPTSDGARLWRFVQELNDRYATAVLSDATAMRTLADKRLLHTIGNKFWYGLRDTRCYSNQEELVTGLNNHAKNAASVKHTVAERVLKMNRGRSGESVIKISISSSTIQCSDVSRPHVPSRTYPSAHELVKQEKELFQFEEGIRWIDMRFLPHITDGEVRLILDGDECIAVRQRPNRGALCAQAGAAWSPVHRRRGDERAPPAGDGVCVCTPDEADRLRAAFLASLPALRELLRLEGAVLPPLWTADFIRHDRGAEERAVPWVLCEFNAMATGYTAFGSATDPNTMRTFGTAMARSIERRFGILHEER